MKKRKRNINKQIVVVEEEDLKRKHRDRERYLENPSWQDVKQKAPRLQVPKYPLLSDKSKHVVEGVSTC
jgi:hypothetical protein